MAMYGAINEAIALTNWPKVRVEARLPPFITVATNGFKLVCIKALPIPSNENDTSISPKLSPKIGRRSEIIVINNDRITVFFRPILFIKILVDKYVAAKKKNNEDTSYDAYRLAHYLVVSILGVSEATITTIRKHLCA